MPDSKTAARLYLARSLPLPRFRNVDTPSQPPEKESALQLFVNSTLAGEGSAASVPRRHQPPGDDLRLDLRCAFEDV